MNVNKKKQQRQAKQTKTTNKKYNERNHQTLVVIVGGLNDNAPKKSNEIYYCVSKDINSKNSNENNQSVWQSSLIKLPSAMLACECVITDKKSNNPKLHILMGDSAKCAITDTYLQYNLCDIIGSQVYTYLLCACFLQRKSLKFYHFVFKKSKKTLKNTTHVRKK